jgi:hypothetical protein
MNEMKQSTASENQLSNLRSGRLVAPTAPLVRDNEVLVVCSLGREAVHCGAFLIDKFISASPAASGSCLFTVYFHLDLPTTSL